MEKVAVIGAGIMGSGIAQSVASKGMHVILSEVSLELAEMGKAGVARALARLVSKEKLTAQDGWYGRKSGRGFYDYSGEAPVPTR